MLAARQPGREVVEPVREPDQRERVGRIHRLSRDVGHQRDVLARGEARDQIVGLEHEADVLAPEARQLRLVRAAEVVVEEVGLAAVGTSSPPRMFSRVDLPLPEGPRSTMNSEG